jgi:exonuclease SbcD
MIRILFISDTHLGFDYPIRPRIVRRRRGPDFFSNYTAALEQAFQKKVDLVVHGGDIFFRSKVRAWLVEMAFEPLHRVAEKGVPVYVVPGNHERSMIPYRICAAHPRVFVFDEPSSYVLKVNDFALVLAGFPFIRHGIREKFPGIIQSTGWASKKADAYVLCMHQSVDGCITGPHNFTFKRHRDVVDIDDIPARFCCTLSGHMHRSQVIAKNLSGNLIPGPVVYAGSIERTSFAELDESKGYMIVDIETEGPHKGKLHACRFLELPTRPMVLLKYELTPGKDDHFETWLRQNLLQIPHDSIVKVKIDGKPDKSILSSVGAENLRRITPCTMNVSVVFNHGVK